MHDWAALHQYQRRFLSGRLAACDDGYLGEGISETVVHMLSHHWSWLPKLAAEMKADPAVGKFVLEHVDATTGYSDLREIRRTATSLCPRTLTGFCRRLRAEITAALRQPE